MVRALASHARGHWFKSSTAHYNVLRAEVFVMLGIIAVAGGASAIKSGSFGLSLGGAIRALLPINTLGILAVIFVSLAKGNFEIE